MSDKLAQSFSTELPVLAGRVWSPTDSGQRCDFIFERSSEQSLDDQCFEGRALGEIVLPSGKVLRCLVPDARKAREALWSLVSDFVAHGGVTSVYGIAPSTNPDDMRQVFCPANLAGEGGRVSRVAINGGAAIGYRIETKSAKVRILIEEDDARATAVSAPALDGPGRATLIDVIPTRHDRGIGVEVVYRPSLAASFFRYLEVDAFDAAAILGRRIVECALDPSVEGTAGDYVAATICTLRFGSPHDRKLAETVCARARSARYAAYANDLTLCAALLQFALGQEDDALARRIIGTFGASNMPSSTWLIFYANRFLSDFAVQSGRVAELRDELRVVSAWSRRLQSNRSYPSYVGGSVEGPDREAPANETERRAEMSAAKKKSEAG